MDILKSNKTLFILIKKYFILNNLFILKKMARICEHCFRKIISRPSETGFSDGLLC
jgi:hypothetical protein